MPWDDVRASTAGGSRIATPTAAATAGLIPDPVLDTQMKEPPDVPTTPLYCHLSVPERQAMVQELYVALADVDDANSVAQAEDALKACEAYTAFMAAADYRRFCVNVGSQKPIGSGGSAEVRRLQHHGLRLYVRQVHTGVIARPWQLVDFNG
jgi:hypothetical protein